VTGKQVTGSHASTAAAPPT